MLGHRISGQYHIIKKSKLWAIYKYWNSDHELCMESFNYLKDAVEWCRNNP